MSLYSEIIKPRHLFLKNKNKINYSKSQINKIQLELNITIGIDNILTIFKNSLKNKSIKWI